MEEVRNIFQRELFVCFFFPIIIYLFCLKILIECTKLYVTFLYDNNFVFCVCITL